MCKIVLRIFIRTTDAIFRNAILKCSKTELLEILHAKSRKYEIFNGNCVRIRESRTVCKLCFMLMHVFGRIGVEWRNLTMDILAYRALLALNFVEKSFSNPSWYRNYVWNHFDIDKAFKYV